jgi:hypothetical protein
VVLTLMRTGTIAVAISSATAPMSWRMTQQRRRQFSAFGRSAWVTARSGTMQWLIVND